jgi:hypothetical protein
MQLGDQVTRYWLRTAAIRQRYLWTPVQQERTDGKGNLPADAPSGLRGGGRLSFFVSS